MPGATGDTSFTWIRFEPNGDVAGSTLDGIRRLDGATLGAAITHLISLEMTLAFAQRRIAGAAIERAFAAGAADGSRVQLDVPGLVGIYRAVVADPSRRDVEELVLRLLATADRAAVIDGHRRHRLRVEVRRFGHRRHRLRGHRRARLRHVSAHDVHAEADASKVDASRRP